jgi:hypothetical protein
VHHRQRVADDGTHAESNRVTVCARRHGALQVRRFDVVRASWGRYVTTRKQRVNLCQECFQRLRRRDRIENAATVIVLAEGAAYLFWLVKYAEQGDWVPLVLKLLRVETLTTIGDGAAVRTG